MANGETLNELRDMLGNGDTIPVKAVNRLTLAALADVLETQKEIKAAVLKLSENPLVRAGFFIASHERLALAVLLLLLMILVLPHAADVWDWVSAFVSKWLDLPAF